MGSKESVNTKTDAFRHAIWNVVMAKEGWGKKVQRWLGPEILPLHMKKGRNM